MHNNTILKLDRQEPGHYTLCGETRTCESRIEVTGHRYISISLSKKGDALAQCLCTASMMVLVQHLNFFNVSLPSSRMMKVFRVLSSDGFQR